MHHVCYFLTFGGVYVINLFEHINRPIPIITLKILNPIPGFPLLGHMKVDCKYEESIPKIQVYKCWFGDGGANG